MSAVDASSESFCGLGVEPPVLGAGVGRVTVIVPSLFGEGIGVGAGVGAGVVGVVGEGGVGAEPPGGEAATPSHLHSPQEPITHGALQLCLLEESSVSLALPLAEDECARSPLSAKTTALSRRRSARHRRAKFRPPATALELDFILREGVGRHA